MAKMIPLSQAKARLSELARAAEDTDVLLMRHSEIAAVLISPQRYEQVLEEIEDLQDRLSVHEREYLTYNWDKVKAELDLP